MKFKGLFLLMCTRVCLCVCVLRPEEGIGSLGVGVTGVCELGTESWVSERVPRFLKHRVVYLGP